MDKEGVSQFSRHQELLLKCYKAFNRQEADTILSFVSEDIDWPDNQVRLHGKDALKKYWLKEWTSIRPHDEPIRIREVSEDLSIVLIDQVIRRLDGTVISRGTFEHTYRFRNGLIVRMDLKKM